MRPLHLGAMFVFLSLLAFSPAARGAEIRDLASGFVVNLEVPKAKVCVVLPKEARDAACAGLDVDTIASSLKGIAQPPMGFALVRFDDWNAMITMVKAENRTTSSDAIRATILGSEDAMKQTFPGVDVRAHGDAPQSRYDVLSVPDANVARYAIDAAIPPSHPKYLMSSTLSYIVAGRDSTYVVTFNATAPHAAATRAFADPIMMGVRLPGSKDSLFGQGREYTLGYMVGKILAYVGMAAIGAIVLAFALRKKRPKSGAMA
jgi:hypothetical protein